MKRFVITFLVLLLVAGPAMAHGAMNHGMQTGNVEISAAPEDHAGHGGNAPDCKTDCERHDIGTCCAFAVVHCETTSMRGDVADYMISRSSERVSFNHIDTSWRRRMPEQETPPPRT